MAEPTNLYITYKKVKQRISRSRDPIARTAAEAAAAAAADLIKCPTLKGVNIFRKIERKWLSLATAGALPLADEFENAIRSKSFIVERPAMNAHHAGWNPPHGTVYCLVCNEMPGCVKVGATTLTVNKRSQLLAGKHCLTGVRITFSLEVGSPSKVEATVHKALRRLRVHGPNGSMEWFKVQPKVAEREVRAAALCDDAV